MRRRINGGATWSPRPAISTTGCSKALLANYSALLYLEKHKGTRATESILNDYRDDLMAKADGGRTLESAGPIALRNAPGIVAESQRPGGPSCIEKGTWILHMLRSRMGDERFDAFLGELRRRFQWKSLDTDIFVCSPPNSCLPESPRSETRFLLRSVGVRNRDSGAQAHVIG